MKYPDGYFKPETYETNPIDDMGHSLVFTIGENTKDADGVIPQLQVSVMQYESRALSYWIDLDKIDEVITALAWAKHRMEEETRGKDSSD